MRATSEQVSCTIGLLPAVEESLSLTHSLDETLLARYLPDVDDAVNVHCCQAAPLVQPHCCSCRPDVVAAPGTSMHWPLLTLTRLYPADAATTRHCCRVAPDAQAAWVSLAPDAVDDDGTSMHFPLAPGTSV